MRRNDVSDASRSTGRFHCPQAPTIWGENRELLFFLTRIFSRKSGQPGNLFLNQPYMRPNGVSDAPRSTARFHCPQAPAIGGVEAAKTLACAVCFASMSLESSRLVRLGI